MVERRPRGARGASRFGRAASRIGTEEAAAEDPIARDEAGILSRQLHLTSAPWSAELRHVSSGSYKGPVAASCACEVEAWDDGPSHEAQGRLVQTPSDADICIVDTEGLEILPTRSDHKSSHWGGLVSHNSEIRSERLRRTRYPLAAEVLISQVPAQSDVSAQSCRALGPGAPSFIKL